MLVFDINYFYIFMLNKSLNSILDVEANKIIAIRHFHSNAQDFRANVFELESRNGWKLTNTRVINQLKEDYSKVIWHDFYAWLSQTWVNFYSNNRHKYKSLMAKILNKPLIIQTSPYIRCLESIWLILSDFNPSIVSSLTTSRREYYEFEVNKVPVILYFNDMLVERDMWNNIYPESLLDIPSNDWAKYLTLAQKQKLRYYEKINWWESMMDVSIRCRLMLQDFLDQWANQLRMSHMLFINQLTNTVNRWSFYWFADESNKNIANGSVSIFQQEDRKMIPQIIWQLP